MFDRNGVTDADRAPARRDRRRRARTHAAAARAALRRTPVPVPAGGRRSLQVLAQPEDLVALRDGWQTLRADFRGPSNHLGWWRAVAHTAAPGTQICVVVLRDAGELVALAPLVRTGPLGCKLALINGDDASGFLYADERALGWLLDAVVGLRRALVLVSLVVGSPTQRLLGRRTRRTGYLRWSREWPMGSSLELSERYEDPLRQLSASRRKSLRRSLRRAESIGTVTFAVEAGADRLDELFGEFVRIEGSGWKGRQGTSLVQDAAQREALRAFILSPEVRDEVRFAWMSIDGERIAGEVAVIAERRLWVLKAGYDESFASVSPGVLTELNLMAWAAREGLERFELMGGMDDAKRPFGEGPRLLHLRVYPPTLRGAVALGVDAATQARRALQPRLRVLAARWRGNRG